MRKVVKICVASYASACIGDQSKNGGETCLTSRQCLFYAIWFGVLNTVCISNVCIFIKCKFFISLFRQKNFFLRKTL